MSVYTKLNEHEIQEILNQYDLGMLQSFHGITGGTLNSNYELTTSKGHYVLTLFERDALETIKPTLKIIEQLAQQQIPCPVALYNQAGDNIQMIRNKPMAIVNYLPGEHVKYFSATHVVNVATMLAKLHIVLKNYSFQGKNVRSQQWVVDTARKVMDKLSLQQQELLVQELIFLDSVKLPSLPQGVIHGDLFRDNILFDGNNITGVLDLYDCCFDYWVLDIAIAVNDCCLNQAGIVDKQLSDIFLQHYQQQRQLTKDELNHWPFFQRLAALMYWLLRLNAKYFLYTGTIVNLLDPNEYQQILQQHVNSS